MPMGKSRSVDLRIRDVLDVLGRLLPERVLSREAADIMRTLAACLPRPGGPDLSTPAGRRNMTRQVWSASDVRNGASLRRSPGVAMGVKVALALDDLLAGRRHLVTSESFLQVVADLGFPICGNSAEGWTAADAMQVSQQAEDGLVEVAFPWRPSPIGSDQRLGISTAHVCLPTLDPIDAPVACSLWTPEGRLEVRRHGPTWLRPVLSPGSWTPITPIRFREAAASGEAWRDSPFLPHTGHCGPTFHLSDYASSRATAKGDSRRIAEARDACLARAGWLCLVDGTVYQATEEPLAGLATLVVDGEVQVGPAWALGGLNSTRNMDTLNCYEGARLCLVGFVSLADWTAAVGSIAPVPSRPDSAGRPSWPRPIDLVRLEFIHPGPTDGRAALKAAAALTPCVQTLSIREAYRLGMTSELAELCHAVVLMNGTETHDRFRGELLSDVEALASCARDVLGRASEPNTVSWAYLAALALLAVTRATMGQADEDEVLVTLRL